MALCHFENPKLLEKLVVGLVDGGKVLLEENKNMFNAFLCYRIRSSAGLNRYTSM
jgi:hypothetical protein